MATLYLVGIGPGGKEHLTVKARAVLRACPVIVGYTPYIELICDFLAGKTVLTSGMTREVERCQQAIAQVKAGYDTCLISSGDPGLYGMAGLALELAEDLDVEVVPGISAMFSAAAEVGAPLMHDCCTISLSDRLTPFTVIEQRLHHAAQADFVIALYNPRSHGRPDHLAHAVAIVHQYQSPQTPVALVKQAGRPDAAHQLTTLANIVYDWVDMQTVVIIGNSQTYVKAGRMITPRGYRLP
jgi:precorrin-3B C17-methyltransferase